MILPITIKNNTIDLTNYIVISAAALIIFTSSSSKVATALVTAIFWFPAICNIKDDVIRGIK